ncbi:MAG TPA: hypothetical protein VGE02_10555 [Gemmatimonadales bacterium]
MLRRRFGILGTLGAILLAIWVIGWAFFGFHEGFWHLLVPVGGVMLIAQGVLRLNAEPGPEG